MQNIRIPPEGRFQYGRSQGGLREESEQGGWKRRGSPRKELRTKSPGDKDLNVGHPQVD